MTPSVDIRDLAKNLLPSAQRLPQWEIMTLALTSWLHRINELFKMYQNGSTDSGYWNPATAYAKKELVRDLKGVFESLSDANTGNPLTDEAYWRKVLPTFIGANERARYNGRYLPLTYELNRYFNTTFRQPPYPAPYDFGLGGGVWSDIYITNKANNFNSFVVYTVEAPTSKVYTTGTDASAVFTVETYGSATTYTYYIHFPIAVYTALGADDAIRESIVRRFVDQYNPSGINYTILTY